MAHDVFISYSSNDKPIADALCAGLEANGVRVWIAPRDIVPGVAWGEAIVDGISASKLMVVVFSDASNRSQQVLREVERAVNKGIGIIPFRIEDVAPTKSMEYFLSSPHWLDALSAPLERHIDELTQTVRVLLQSKVVQPEPVARPRVVAAEPGPRPTVAPDDWYHREGGWLKRFLAMFDDR